MNNQTIIKFVKEFYEERGEIISDKESGDSIVAVFEAIKKALAHDKHVVIDGFGEFTTNGNHDVLFGSFAEASEAIRNEELHLLFLEHFLFLEGEK